ncbi:uncharacterized protein [Drosophila pseudoobscura]|uniref:Uncharacterized protein isoform X1 n=1 Tax=Drosophila pseudoobscura pseudoobscura TaxID=46245 RepID=A0A6I8WCV7_DROPS|nr:uncharacterized protein LOC26532449 isoform X1 [Drosophila pseudoobscura]
MTFERLSEQPAKKSAPPIPQKRSKSFQLCMKNQRRTISHRCCDVVPGKQQLNEQFWFTGKNNKEIWPTVMTNICIFLHLAHIHAYDVEVVYVAGRIVFFTDISCTSFSTNCVT